MLTRNDNYWGEKAKVKNFELRVITEPSQAEIEMENGNVDLILEPGDSDVKRVMNGEVDGLTTINLQTGGVSNLWFNFKKEWANNQYVRQAINCAIDKDAIVKAAQGGFPTVANQKINPNFCGYIKDYDTNPLYPFDVERAKQLMQQSGMSNLSMYLYVDTLTSNVTTAEIVKKCLEEIGIQVNIVSVEGSAFAPAVIGGEEDDMYLCIGCTSNGTSAGFLQISDPKFTPNWGHWSEAGIYNDIYPIYIEALATTDLEASDKLVQKAIKMETEAALSVPLFYTYANLISVKNLKGLTFATNNTVRYNECYFE
jgi:ABC-type transport system substrate-binding protein